VVYYLTHGSHPGILMIITINSAAKPVLITSADACGCHKAPAPTKNLPDAALPCGWLKAAMPQRIVVERYRVASPLMAAVDNG